MPIPRTWGICINIYNLHLHRRPPFPQNHASGVFVHFWKLRQAFVPEIPQVLFTPHPKSISDHKDSFVYETGIFLAESLYWGEFGIAFPLFIPGRQ